MLFGKIRAYIANNPGCTAADLHKAFSATPQFINPGGRMGQTASPQTGAAHPAPPAQSHSAPATITSHAPIPGEDGNNSNSTGQHPDQPINTESSTTLVADAPGAIAVEKEQIGIPSTLISGDVGAKWSTLQDFLAKPFTNSNLRGVLSSTDTTTTTGFVNNQFWFMDPLTKGSFIENTIATDKLKGIYSLRADLVIRMVVNANVFQQGRYILAFLPSGGAGFTGQYAPSYAYNEGAWFTSLQYDKCRITQLPHVEIDLSQQTECTLVIPYTSCTTHWIVCPNASTEQYKLGNPGKIAIFPYAALSTGTGSPTTASYQLFISYHNVQFSTSAVPQMAIVDEERKRPISSVAHHVSRIAGVVGATVPTISSITTPIQWASDLVAGIATMFGYSNPLNLEATQRNALTWFPFALNPDATDTSLPLSLMSRNDVEALTGVGGTDLDESSIDFIKQVPAWIGTLSFTTSNLIGDNLLWFPLTPETCIGGSSFLGGSAYTYSTVNNFGTSGGGNYAGTTTITSCTPVNYVSQLFYKYRGGLKFKLKFVKTSFHSGRLAIVYQPYTYGYNSTATPSYDNTIYAHRDVIDIRTASEYIFSVPYTAVTPYKELWGNQIDPFGYLGIYVVNPVVAPSTVSSTINIIVEVMAGDDMEFQIPRVTPLNPGLSQVARTQMDAKGLLTNETFVGETHGSPHTVHPAKYCIGEKLNSLYQLIKSAYPVTPGISSTFAHNYINIDPAAIGCEVLQTTTTVMRNYYTYAATPALNLEIPAHNYTRIALMYAMNRGGFRVKAFQFGTGTSTNVVISSAGINNTGTNSGTYAGVNGFDSLTLTNLTLAQNQNFTGGSEVQVPMYCKTFARATPNLIYNANAGSSSGNALPKTDYLDGASSGVSVTVGTPAGHFTNPAFMVATSDDFQMFQFIGAPLLFGYS